MPSPYSEEELAREEEALQNDPFDLPVNDFPNRIGSIKWEKRSKWKPNLRLVPKFGGGNQIVGRPSDIAQGILYHMGKPLQLNSHAFLTPIYNRQDTHVVLKCSRQVAKSTTVACIQVLESLWTPHMRSLYVSPSSLQTRQYSNEKLRPTVYESPIIKKYFVGKGVIDQVFEKTLLNGSYMFLRYAFLTAARARGIPASRVFFDEAQDLLKDNIKVISQSLSAARLHGQPGRELLAGTPLTHVNTLEEYWRWSTQNEWLVPCDKHSPPVWNLLGVDNIGKTGLVCSKCSSLINPAMGRWTSFKKNEAYTGYHITQLMVPWKQDPDAWKREIVLPFEKWPESKFQNEILGNAHDNASSPISQMDIQECCWPKKQVGRYSSETFVRSPNEQTRSLIVYGGIDWGEGRQEGEVVGGRKKYASWTVLTLGAYIDDNTFWTFYMKKYIGQEIDPEFILPDILNIVGAYNVYRLGVDWGHGWGLNSRLFKALGHDRVMQFAYSGNLNERKRWDDGAYKFIINRNAVLSNYFEGIRKGEFLFPKWGEFEPFAEDILAEYVEYNENTRTMKYDHPIDQPDDALHSQIYCKLAADITLERF